MREGCHLPWQRCTQASPHIKQMFSIFVSGVVKFLGELSRQVPGNSKGGVGRPAPNEVAVSVPCLLEVIDTVFVGDDDVEEAVGVHVVDFEGGADATVGVEDVFGPGGLSIFAL